MKMRKVVAVCGSVALFGTVVVGLTGCGEVKEEDIPIYETRANHKCGTYEIDEITDIVYQKYTSYVDIANDIPDFCIYHSDEDYRAIVPIEFMENSFDVYMKFSEDKELKEIECTAMPETLFETVKEQLDDAYGYTANYSYMDGFWRVYEWNTDSDDEDPLVRLEHSAGLRFSVS